MAYRKKKSTGYNTTMYKTKTAAKKALKPGQTIKKVVRYDVKGRARKK